MSAFKLTPTGELMAFLVGLSLPKGSQADEIRERGIAWLRQAPEDFEAREGDLRARITELEAEIAQLRQSLMMLLSFHESVGSPSPAAPCEIARALLSNPSPSAQALARLVEADS